MNSLDLARLLPLMRLTSGAGDLPVALIDGPVAADHPELAGASIRVIGDGAAGACRLPDSAACLHGTFIAGILCARRGGAAPAICPGCPLQARPIFPEAPPDGRFPSATPEELARAVMECVRAGARVLNMSIAMARPSSQGQRDLEEALDQAARRGVLIVAAAGNQGTVGSSVITRHPGVIPVVACDADGRPIGQSNLSGAIGRSGLRAPGDRVSSLTPNGETATLGGTSVAAPFVTGAAALLWSLFPSAPAADIRAALTQAGGARRTSVVPPLLDAWAAYQTLAARHNGR